MTATRRVAIIMAGGSGERFWPLSRARRPKQLLKLTSETETLLQEAVSRVLPLLPAENIYIATSRALASAIGEGDPRVPAGNVLAEPCKRNTTGCLVWAAANLMAGLGEGADVTMAILTADHQIGEHDNFRATIDAAMAAAEQHRALVTIGIPPTRPDTGYGYIELGDETVDVGGHGATTCHAVRRFREKPGARQAEEYVASGHYFWNSGMFFWRLSTFLSELEQARPETAAICRDIAQALRAGDAAQADRHFERLEGISIDYALLERARRVLVMRSPFPWDDVGSWDALERTLPADGAGNVAVGAPVMVDIQDSIIYNEAPSEVAVAAIGLSGVVIVATRDGILVASKDRVQEVRQAVEELRRRGAGQV